MGRKRSGRVKISRKPIEIIAISEQILAKHTEDGADSLLNSINSRLKLEEMEALVATARQKMQDAERLRGEAENARQQRDIALAKLVKKQRDASVYLKSFYSDNPHELVHWGFGVDSSPQRKKKENGADKA